MILIFWVFVSILAPFISASVFQNEVSNGKLSRPNEYPHLVELFYYSPQMKEIFFCGGSLINSLTVLTAAHCVEFKNAATIYIKVGTNNLQEDNIIAHCIDYKIHHDWNSITESYKGDIALLQLENEIFENFNSIRYMDLDDEDFLIPLESEVDIAGFGYTNESEIENFKMYCAIIAVTENANCPSSIESDSMICAGDGLGTDTCSGDSGTSLVRVKSINDKRWTGSGITAYAYVADCGAINHYVVYTRISYYTQWIWSNIWGSKPSSLPESTPPLSYIDERFCPYQMFGENCDVQCTCVNGLCTSDENTCPVCEYKWVGEKCDIPCECIHGNCSVTERNCICEYGYFGVLCDEQCEVITPQVNTTCNNTVVNNITSCNSLGSLVVLDTVVGIAVPFLLVLIIGNIFLMVVIGIVLFVVISFLCKINVKKNMKKRDEVLSRELSKIKNVKPSESSMKKVIEDKKEEKIVYEDEIEINLRSFMSFKEKEREKSRKENLLLSMGFKKKDALEALKHERYSLYKSFVYLISKSFIQMSDEIKVDENLKFLKKRREELERVERCLINYKSRINIRKKQIISKVEKESEESEEEEEGESEYETETSEEDVDLYDEKSKLSLEGFFQGNKCKFNMKEKGFVIITYDNKILLMVQYSNIDEINKEKSEKMINFSVNCNGEKYTFFFEKEVSDLFKEFLLEKIM